MTSDRPGGAKAPRKRLRPLEDCKADIKKFFQDKL